MSVSIETVSPELIVSRGFSRGSSQPHCTSSGVALSTWCLPADAGPAPARPGPAIEAPAIENTTRGRQRDAARARDMDAPWEGLAPRYRGFVSPGGPAGSFGTTPTAPAAAHGPAPGAWHAASQARPGHAGLARGGAPRA